MTIDQDPKKVINDRLQRCVKKLFKFGQNSIFTDLFENLQIFSYFRFSFQIHYFSLLTHKS